MEISREHFDGAILEVMDEVAMLLFISQSLRKMNPTFRNSAEIDKLHANKPATDVLKSVGEVAQNLLAALFANATDRPGMLVVAREDGLQKLLVAQKKAMKLASMERKAYSGEEVSGAAVGKRVIANSHINVVGNVIEKQVIANLQRIILRWNSQLDGEIDGLVHSGNLSQDALLSSHVNEVIVGP